MRSIRQEILSESWTRLSGGGFAPKHGQSGTPSDNTLGAAKGYFGDAAGAVLLDQIRGTYPIIKSLYYSAEMIALAGQREPAESLSNLRNYFVVPSDRALRTLFEVAAASDECVLRRSYFYDLLIELGD